MMSGNYPSSPQQTRLATCCYVVTYHNSHNHVKALKTSFYCDARVVLPPSLHSPSVSQNNLKLNAMGVVGVTPASQYTDNQSDKVTHNLSFLLIVRFVWGGLGQGMLHNLKPSDIASIQ